MKKVAVLMGGCSSERDISLQSGEGVAEALVGLGYSVSRLDWSGDGAELVEMLTAERPDVVFNALHGRFGEDGCVQGLLNMMRIPYTHSGVAASAIGMDKDLTRQLAENADIDVAAGRLMMREDFLSGGEPIMPYVIKPNADGSSVGVFIVRDEADRERALAAWPAGEVRLLEDYIAGRELSVAVLDGCAIGVVEIIPKSGYYDFTNKYQEGGARHVIPAEIGSEMTALAKDWAEQMHTMIGCRGVSRCDFRLNDRANPENPRLVLLEINTNPGMTRLSLVPELARICRQMSYAELVRHLVEEATCDN